MYDTIIIGAGMSGLAAGIRLAYYDQRVCILERHYTIGGLNSFYRLGGRDYDVGLHAADQLHAQGHARRARWPGCCGSCGFSGTISPLRRRSARRSRFPACGCGSTTTSTLLASEVARAFPARERQLRPARRARSSTTTTSSETHADLSARAGRRRDHHRAAAGRDAVLPADVLRPAREHDMDLGQFSIMFRSIFLEGLGRPQAGVRLILKHLVRKFQALGGELRLRAGVKRLAVERRTA